METTAGGIIAVAHLPQVTVERKLLMTICRLANRETYRRWVIGSDVVEVIK